MSILIVVVTGEAFFTDNYPLCRALLWVKLLQRTNNRMNQDHLSHHDPRD